ncbi:uncharacterized protein LOC128214985 [Mya arenaria]|uniref:uncharacterized protein LOC128214985 n=1 Tax=Mya arenaria TaxID=6604 RepID=UPI0022E326FE|nr:uncharacterized protein LOC128214985 [Mya arenaria]
MFCSLLTSAILLTAVFAAVFAEPATKFKDQLVNKHNEYRKKQGATNMNKLVWSDKLANLAEKWVSRCNFEHENKGFGENLAFSTKTDDVVNIDEAMQNWYDEIKDYNYAGKKCTPMSCHYTQLVWSQTREVGCAIKKCPSMSGMGQHVKDAWYIGCWYDPKGNDMAEFPYLSGAACSACLEGQTCEDGLCAGVGKEKCEDKSPRKDCVMWEASGNCQSNKPYMEKNCRQSCGFCTGGAQQACEDLSPKCEVWKKTCESNKSFMKPNCMKTCNFCEGGKRSIYEDMESRMLADRAVDTGDCKDTRADCYDLRTSCSDSNVRADCPVTCDTCPSSRRSNLARGLLRELMMADRTVDTGDCKDTRADCHDLRTSCSNSAALRADCPVTCDTCPSSRRSDLAPLLARAALLEDLMLADRAVDTGACQDKRSDCHDQRMKCGSDPDLRKNCPVTCDTCPAQ